MKNAETEWNTYYADRNWLKRNNSTIFKRMRRIKKAMKRRKKMEATSATKIIWNEKQKNTEKELKAGKKNREPATKIQGSIHVTKMLNVLRKRTNPLRCAFIPYFRVVVVVFRLCVPHTPNFLLHAKFLRFFFCFFLWFFFLVFSGENFSYLQQPNASDHHHHLHQKKKMRKKEVNLCKRCCVPQLPFFFLSLSLIENVCSLNCVQWILVYTCV